MEVPEQSSSLDVGRVRVTDRDLRGSPNWMAKYSIISGDPQGAFSIRTDSHTNEGILSLVKVTMIAVHIESNWWKDWIALFLGLYRLIIQWSSDQEAIIYNLLCSLIASRWCCCALWLPRRGRLIALPYSMSEYVVKIYCISFPRTPRPTVVV